MVRPFLVLVLDGKLVELGANGISILFDELGGQDLVRVYSDALSELIGGFFSELKD